MSEYQTVEVRFPAEKVESRTGAIDTKTLYRAREGLYHVHTSEHGGEAWMESGAGDGMPEDQARALWPELFEA